MADRDGDSDGAGLLDSTANVWATATPPASSPSAVKALETRFDDFDPFKPDASSDKPEDGEVRQQEQRQDEDAEKAAPPTPVKATKAAPAPPLPSKAVTTSEASPASAIHDLSASSATTDAPQPSGTPTKAKPVAAASQLMTPTASSGSGLGNPLATIASAFRRRDLSNTSASTSSSRPQTPTGKAAPAVLVLDKDDTDDIDESEKEAPPAIPSVGHHADTDNGSDGEPSEEAAPFDFNLFLEQMRSRPAEPIGKYLRSFLKEFGKRTYGVNDQIRVINDFLDFIAVKMRENEVWRNASEKEFDNAVEAMEKLVMNRLHHQTFVPALSEAQKATTQTDDLERDHVLSQRIRLFGWVDESHLDLPKHADSESFIAFGKQEICKVNSYKAPRDKLICILNCCKVIFGLMRHLSLEDGADTFIPFLILVILRSNPDHLISNVQYIQRFRNPERLSGENGYYLSSLTGAISFIETMDSSSLSNLTQAEFEAKVGEAIQSLPSEEPDKPEALPAPVVTTPQLQQAQFQAPQSPAKSPRRQQQQRLPHSSSSSSLRTPAQDAEEQQRSVSPAEATRDFIIKSSDNLQKTVSKPLQALGRIFTEMGSDSEIVAGMPGRQQQLHQQHHPHQHVSQHPYDPRQQPPQQQQQHHGQAQQAGYPGALYPFQGAQSRPVPARSRSTASSVASPTSPTAQHRRRGYNPTYIQGGNPNIPADISSPGRPTGPNQRSASYQAGDFVDDRVSAEQVQAEADRQHRATFSAKIDTLASIFPGIERETLEIVLLSNGEDVERSIEGLLEMA